MLRLVNNILDLQRLESGEQPLQLRPVDVGQFLEEAMAVVRPHANEKEVRTFVEVEPGLPALITDELLLRRAVDNLLSNAVKYTRAGDSVTLSASLEGAGIAIRVTDTGIGLTREERDRLFERFFRGKRFEARVERGTGLGLTIVREAARMLEGQVSVDSMLGEGSTFTLWLPISAPITGGEGTGERSAT
jgi:signal transduction histidine kinase